MKANLTWRTVHLTHIILAILWCIALPFLARAEDIRPGQELVKVVTFTDDGTAITYEVRPKLHVCHFNWPASRFPMPPDTDPQRRVRAGRMAAYIAKRNKSADAPAIAEYFLSAEDAYPDVPAELLMAIARYESSYRVKCSNGSCFGLLQLHRASHKKHLQELGLTWGVPADEVKYAAWLVHTNLASGKSLYGSISAWTVRSKAWAEYKRLK